MYMSKRKVVNVLLYIVSLAAELVKVQSLIQLSRYNSLSGVWGAHFPVTRKSRVQPRLSATFFRLSTLGLPVAHFAIAPLLSPAIFSRSETLIPLALHSSRIRARITVAPPFGLVVVKGL